MGGVTQKRRCTYRPSAILLIVIKHSPPPPLNPKNSRTQHDQQHAGPNVQAPSEEQQKLVESKPT